MPRHANERIYLGPKTNEVIVSIGRSHDVGMAESVAVEITFTRKRITDAVSSTWTTYSFSEGNAHFEPPSEFLTNITDFPKGIYHGEVTVDGCHIADIELIKAPGHYITKAESVEDSCRETGWVEPDCTVEDAEITDACSTCTTCSCTGNETCSTCYNTTYIKTINVKEGFIDWSQDIVDGCTIDDVTPDSSTITCTDSEDNACVSEESDNGPLSEIQTVNIKEDYLDDNDC